MIRESSASLAINPPITDLLMTRTTTAETFNGWANWETWNVALWIQNDESLYNAACGCGGSYAELLELLWEAGSKETPDGCRWNDLKVDAEEINSMLADL